MQICLFTALPLSRSSPCGFLCALALEGRRKPVNLASEVSADLSDFSTVLQTSFVMRGRSLVVSIPFAWENLHLVVSIATRPSRLYLRYSVVLKSLTTGGILHAGCEFRQASDLHNKSGMFLHGTFRFIIAYPACAVYRGVLNLLLQVGSYQATPPWLRPIALLL